MTMPTQRTAPAAQRAPSNRNDSSAQGSGGNAVQLSGALRGKDFAAQEQMLAPRGGGPARAPSAAVQLKPAVQQKGIPEGQVDVTFNAFYKLEKGKPENKGKSDAELIELALARTRAQVGGGMPEGYVPPPLRGGAGSGGAAAGPAVGVVDPSQQSHTDPFADDGMSDPNGECIDPNGQSVDPSLQPTNPLDELPDPNGQSVDPDAGSTPAPSNPDLEFGMGFPKIGPFGLELGATTKGDLMVSGKWDLKDIKALVVPIFEGVYLQAKPEVTGGFQLKGNPATKEVSLTGSLAASLAATLRVGLPNILSAGVGGEVKGSISVTGGWSEAKGWDLGPVTIDLEGALIATGEIGPMEFKTTFGAVKLVTVTIGATSGVQVKPGPDVEALWNRLTGWDQESYEYSLAQCNEFQGTDDPNCSMGAGGGVPAGPPSGGGGAGGAGGAGGS